MQGKVLFYILICVYVNGCNFAIWPINVKYSHTKCYLKGSVFCIHSCCRRYMLLKYCQHGVKHYPSNTFMLNAQSCTFTNFTTEYKRFTRLHGLCNFFFKFDIDKFLWPSDGEIRCCPLLRTTINTL